MTDGVAAELDRSSLVELHSVGAGAPHETSVPEIEPRLAQASTVVQQPVPRDLAPAAQGLVPRFPLDEQGTWLVLYDSAPGELRAVWSLARTDMERFGASFPVNGSRPAPVLRLRRSGPEGGTELVDEVSLLRVARERTGDVSFRVERDHCRYHAELGLATGDGGWLMLARSSGVDNAAGIGPRLPVSEERHRPLAASREPAAGPDADAPRRDAGADRGLVAGPGDATAWDGPLAAALPSPHSSPVDASLHPPGPAQRDPIGPDFGLVPQFPLVDSAQHRSPVEPGGTTPASADLGVPTVDGTGLSLGLGETGLPGDVLPAMRPQLAQVPPIGRSLGPAPGLGLPEVETLADCVRIEPQVYGARPTWALGPRMEAELRILGEAAPGSLIDLFGHPFRVGPGGRFQLTLRVDDPDLLRRALELQPPPELKIRRDD